MGIFEDLGIPQNGDKHRPRPTINDVEVLIMDVVEEYRFELGEDAPVITSKIEEGNAEFTLGEFPFLMVVPGDDGEFILVEPYSNDDYPIYRGQPDHEFFGFVRHEVKAELRKELMPGFRFSDDEEPGMQNTAGNHPRSGF